MSSSADRLAAAHLLMRVEQGGYSSRLLSGRVRPGVRSRVLGVLRWQRRLDAALSVPSKRPIDTLDPEVRMTLRVGLFEVVVLGVPAPVATDGAVHMVRRLGCGSASGMVNAVLRRSPAEWRRSADATAPLRHSHPDWLWDKWSAAFGAAAAESAMAAAQQPAAVWVWWTHGEARARATNGGGQLAAHRWCPGAWSSPGRDAHLVRAVAAGEAYAQDPSSQLVAHVARSIASPRALMVDLCAAPGGKAALWRRLGGEAPLALDRHFGRTRLVPPLLDSVGGGLVAVSDAVHPPLRPGSCDLVLVDAPCSGTGTLQRHPELKWRLDPSSLSRMADVQAAILNAGLQLLRSGGVVLYSTCSVEPEENEEHFRPLPTEMELVDLMSHLPEGVPALPTPARGARILPDHDCDGFTLHAVRRQSGHRDPVGFGNEK